MNKTIEEYLKNPNKCLFCGKDILPKENQKISDVKIKKFCNRSCAAKFNNAPKKIKKICINCGKPINKGASKFCSHNCQQIYNHNVYIQEWKQGMHCDTIEVSNHVRTYLFEINENRCSRCGWGETNPYTNKIPLQIHHKDGNYRNNSEDNLELLCPNCHALTENFGALNIGNGRDYRYKK